MTRTTRISAVKKASPAQESTSGRTQSSDRDDVNLAVVVGRAAKDAVTTESADGSVYTSFDIVCHADGVRSVVPVSCQGECAVLAGQRVAVTGTVHKRFFAAGAGLASRTDVRADMVRIITRKDHVSRVIASAVAVLGGD